MVSGYSVEDCTLTAVRTDHGAALDLAQDFGMILSALSRDLSFKGTRAHECDALGP